MRSGRAVAAVRRHVARSHATDWLVRYPRTVLCLVGSLLVVAGVFGWKAPSALVSGGYSPMDSESAHGDALLASGFHGGAPNLVLLATSQANVADAAATAQGREITNRIRSTDGVVFADSYWTSGARSLLGADGHTALVLVRIAGSEADAQRTAKRLLPSVTGQHGPLTVRATGTVQLNLDAESQGQRDLDRAELIAAPLTLLVLLLAFGSLLGSLLPLLVGVVAVVGTMAVLRAMTTVTEVSIYAVNITTALGFGLAVDYSLFIVTRFREELAAGRGVQEAASVAVRRAGRAVLFSAATAALALAAMLVFPLVYLRSLAFAGIAVMVLAALSAVVVLGPVLVLLGHRVNRGRTTPAAYLRSRPGRHVLQEGFWHRIAMFVMRRPLIMGGAVTALLVLLAVPFTHASFATADDRILPPDAPAHVTADLVRAAFPGGRTTPLTVVLPGIDAARDARQVSAYAEALSRLPDVEEVATASGSYAAGLHTTGPVPASARFASPAGTWLQVFSSTIPHSAAGERLVHDVRAVPAPPGRLVSGDAATVVDTKQTLTSRLPVAGLLIVGTMLVLLFLFTGSVVIPVKAAVLGALSLTASFGAVVWIFQEGHLRELLGDFTVTGQLELTTPVLMFCIAFGLSMDYEVFLLARIREEYLRTGRNLEAVARGLARTGRVVSAAALVVTVVLGALATSGLTMLKMLGVGLAVAVVVDATLVRGVLLPATMRVLGRGNWWSPRPLRRLHEWLGLHES